MVCFVEVVGSWVVVIYVFILGKVVVGVDINVMYYVFGCVGLVIVMVIVIKLGCMLCSYEVIIIDEDGKCLCIVWIINVVVDKK